MASLSGMQIPASIRSASASKRSPSRLPPQPAHLSQSRRPKLKYSLTISQRCSAAWFVCRASSVEAPPGLRTEAWTGSEVQIQAFEAVKERMKGTPNGMPTDETVQWFLRDRKFDVEETVEKLGTMMKWRSEFRVDEITEDMVAAEAATGKAELWKFPDNCGQPVVVVRVDKHVPGVVPVEDSQRMCVYILEKAQAQAVSSGTETMLGVFDLGKFSPSNADLMFVKFLVDAFFVYYPKRLSQVLFVDAPWVFQPAWSAIKPWLKKYAALVRFVSSEELRNEYFTPETCPEDFKR